MPFNMTAAAVPSSMLSGKSTKSRAGSARIVT